MELNLHEITFRNILDTLIEGVQVISFDYRYLYVNESLARQSHYNKTDLTGRFMKEVYPSIEKTAAFQALQHCMEHRVSRQIEHEITYPDKTKGWFDLSIQPVAEGLFVLSVDITARKFAEHAIRSAENKFRNLTETAFDAIVLMDGKGKVQFWNHGAELIFGYSMEEVLQKPLTVIMPEKYRAAHQQGMERYLRTGEKRVIGKVVELEGMRKSGEVFPIEISITSWENEGVPVFSGIIRDISERKQAQSNILKLNEVLEQKVIERTAQLERNIQQLKESEEKFQKAFQGSAAGIAIARLSDSTYTEVNDSFVDLVGYSREELIGHTSVELGIVLDIRKRDEILRSMREQGWARNFEVTVRDKEGKIREVLGSIETIQLNNEKYALNIIYDITDRKRAEQQIRAANEELAALNEELSASNEELQTSNDQLIELNMKLEAAGRIIEAQAQKILRQKDEQLNRALDSSSVAIWSFDLTGAAQNYLSRSVEKIYNRPLSEVDNNPVFWQDQVSPDDREIALAAHEQLLRHGLAECTCQIIMPDKSMRWIRQQLHLVKDEHGRSMRLEGITTDITALKEAEDSRRQLEAERRKAEEGRKEKELVDLKSKFISMATHEFRTPLSSIMLSADMIRRYKEKLSPAQIEEKTDDIIQHISYMTQLLDDVLIIGKTDAGKMEVHLEELELVLFFEKIVTQVETSGNTHTVRRDFRCPEKTVVTDPKLLRNIVTNLLTNAVKFSPDSPTVDLELNCTASEITIRIQDYGIGIPEADLKRLFEPFFRASNADAIEGTGLGLSIIKRATELLRGTITVNSEIGKGTAFIITLPIR